MYWLNYIAVFLIATSNIIKKMCDQIFMLTGISVNCQNWVKLGNSAGEDLKKVKQKWNDIYVINIT